MVKENTGWAVKNLKFYPKACEPLAAHSWEPEFFEPRHLLTGE